MIRRDDVVGPVHQRLVAAGHSHLRFSFRFGLYELSAVGGRCRQGQSAAQIAAEPPDIPFSHIHAALAYYLANSDQIDAELAAEPAAHDQLY